MAVTITQVNTAADTFQVLIDRTNEVINAMSTQVLTANNDANGAQVTGNSYVVGTVGGLTVVANTLRGGNVQSSANLTVSSNLSVTGTFLYVGGKVDYGNSTVNAISNSTIVKLQGPSTNATLTDTALTIGSTIVVNTVQISVGNLVANNSRLKIGNSSINAAMNASALTFSNSTVSAVLDRADIATLDTLATNIIIANTTTTGATASLVDSFAKASFRSAKYSVSVTDNNANAHSAAEILTIHENHATEALYTVYAELNTNGVMGVWSANSNATHVLLYWTPTSTNTTVQYTRIGTPV